MAVAEARSAQRYGADLTATREPRAPGADSGELNWESAVETARCGLCIGGATEMNERVDFDELTLLGQFTAREPTPVLVREGER